MKANPGLEKQIGIVSNDIEKIKHLEQALHYKVATGEDFRFEIRKLIVKFNKIAQIYADYEDESACRKSLTQAKLLVEKYLTPEEALWCKLYGMTLSNLAHLEYRHSNWATASDHFKCASTLGALSGRGHVAYADAALQLERYNEAEQLNKVAINLLQHSKSQKSRRKERTGTTGNGKLSSSHYDPMSGETTGVRTNGNHQSTSIPNLPLLIKAYANLALAREMQQKPAGDSYHTAIRLAVEHYGPHSTLVKQLKKARHESSSTPSSPSPTPVLAASSSSEDDEHHHITRDDSDNTPVNIHAFPNVSVSVSVSPHHASHTQSATISTSSGHHHHHSCCTALRQVSVKDDQTGPTRSSTPCSSCCHCCCCRCHNVSMCVNCHEPTSTSPTQSTPAYTPTPPLTITPTAKSRPLTAMYSLPANQLERSAKGSDAAAQDKPLKSHHAMTDVDNLVESVGGTTSTLRHVDQLLGHGTKHTISIQQYITQLDSQLPERCPPLPTPPPPPLSHPHSQKNKHNWKYNDASWCTTTPAPRITHREGHTTLPIVSVRTSRKSSMESTENFVGQWNFKDGTTAATRIQSWYILMHNGVTCRRTRIAMALLPARQHRLTENEKISRQQILEEEELYWSSYVSATAVLHKYIHTTTELSESELTEKPHKNVEQKECNRGGNSGDCCVGTWRHTTSSATAENSGTGKSAKLWESSKSEGTKAKQRPAAPSSKHLVPTNRYIKWINIQATGHPYTLFAAAASIQRWYLRVAPQVPYRRRKQLRTALCATWLHKTCFLENEERVEIVEEEGVVYSDLVQYKQQHRASLTKFIAKKELEMTRLLLRSEENVQSECHVVKQFMKAERVGRQELTHQYQVQFMDIVDDHKVPPITLLQTKHEYDSRRDIERQQQWNRQWLSDALTLHDDEHCHRLQVQQLYKQSRTDLILEVQNYQKDVITHQISNILRHQLLLCEVDEDASRQHLTQYEHHECNLLQFLNTEIERRVYIIREERLYLRVHTNAFDARIGSFVQPPTESDDTEILERLGLSGSSQTIPPEDRGSGTITIEEDRMPLDSSSNLSPLTSKNICNVSIPYTSTQEGSSNSSTGSMSCMSSLVQPLCSPAYAQTRTSVLVQQQLHGNISSSLTSGGTQHPVPSHSPEGWITKLSPDTIPRSGNNESFVTLVTTNTNRSIKHSAKHTSAAMDGPFKTVRQQRTESDKRLRTEQYRAAHTQYTIQRNRTSTE